MKAGIPGFARLALAYTAALALAAVGGGASSSSPAPKDALPVEPEGSHANEKRLEERLPDGVRTTFFADPDKLGVYRTKTEILEMDEALDVVVRVYRLKGGKWELERERRDRKLKAEESSREARVQTNREARVEKRP